MPKTSSKPPVATAASEDPARKKRAPKKAKAAKTVKAKAVPGKPASTPAKKAPRLAARKTFLIAATMPDGGTKRDLRVYAVVQRTPVEALAAVQAELGFDVAVELAGKLSNRMAKTLGIKSDEVRQI